MHAPRRPAPPARTCRSAACSCAAMVHVADPRQPPPRRRSVARANPLGSRASVRRRSASPLEHRPILEVRDLVKEYPATTAVAGVSFSVPAGICFGLLGPNGAGKTTTIEIMEGILPPTSGEVRYRGEPARRALSRGGRHPVPEDRAAGLPHRTPEHRAVSRPVCPRPRRRGGDPPVRARETRRAAMPASSPAASSSGCCSPSRW